MRLLIGLCLLASLALPLAAGAAPAQSGAAAGDYIVVLKAGVSGKAVAAEHARAYGASVFQQYSAALNGYAAHLSEQALAHIRADGRVAFVSEDRAVQATDALAGGETVPTGVRRSGNASSSTAQPAASVAVAVIDTGIDLSHPDLNASAGTNCTGTGAPNDDNGHGSHVAGSIAARNTGSGVVGVAPGTKLYAVKVLNRQGSGTWSGVICGIDWVTANAAALDIRVASMSLGGSGTSDTNCGNSNGDALHKAICNSKAAGVTYVVAAGNSGANLAGSVPAAYPEAVTVTAVSDSDGLPGATGGAPTCRSGEQDDRYASFSNYAASSDSAAIAHTVAAPGVCILSTWKSGGYATISGTSMATPHVSGAVALCVSSGACTAGASPSSVIGAIRTTDAAKGFVGDPARPVSGRYYGYIIWGALGSSGSTVTAPGAPTLDSATAGNQSVALAWSPPSSNGGGAITGYRVYRNGSLAATLGNVTSYTDTGLTNGTTYTYRVSALNSAGEGGLSNSLSATPTAPAGATAPSAPQNLTAAPAKGKGIQLGWSAPSSDGGSALQGYRIYRNGMLLATTTNTSYKDTATTRGGSYSYYVTAFNAVGEGPASNTTGTIVATK